MRRAQWARREYKVRLDRQVASGLWELRAPSAHSDRLAQPEQLGLRAWWAQLAFKGHPERKVRQAQPGVSVRKVRQALSVRKERQVCKARLDRKVRQGLREPLGRQVQRAFKVR